MINKNCETRGVPSDSRRSAAWSASGVTAPIVAIVTAGRSPTARRNG
jgi:hypothetical protein